jgi:hypothetical protein
MHTSYCMPLVWWGGVTRGCLSGHFGGICDESTSTSSSFIAFLVYKRRVNLRCLKCVSSVYSLQAIESHLCISTEESRVDWKNEI